MADPEAALVMTAATTVVAAMATSAWQSVRDGAVRLFRRGGDDHQRSALTQLDEDAALVSRSEDAARAREALAAAWELRLADLIRRHPEVRDELRDFAEQAAAASARSERAWVQTNVARDGGRVFAAQGGDVVVHHTPPQRTEPPSPGNDG